MVGVEVTTKLLNNPVEFFYPRNSSYAHKYLDWYVKIMMGIQTLQTMDMGSVLIFETTIFILVCFE